MRLLSKLHGCAAAVILLMLYFCYELRSDGISFIRSRPIRVDMHRIVVFGDDWSDTGAYAVSPPGLSPVAARDPDQGEQWTETLCKELVCNAIDNFARSLPIAANAQNHGSLVDEDTHAQARNLKSNAKTPPDFKTQVQQFLQYEKKFDTVPQQSDTGENVEWTIFTVLFGLWDLLEYAKMEKEFAMLGIENSTKSLFENLDLLAEQVPTMRVVIPLMADLTFLPRFQMARSEADEDFAEDQHMMIFLWTYWNAVLLQEAMQWNNGDIFMPDMNSILMDQVRAWQLYYEKISDASNVGRQSPMFDNVVLPCLTRRPDENKSTLHAAPIDKCAKPAAHLFWDDIHLSGKVHQLIGSAAASLLRSNRIVNIERATQGSIKYDGPGVQEGDGFNLKLPPGY